MRTAQIGPDLRLVPRGSTVIQNRPSPGHLIGGLLRTVGIHSGILAFPILAFDFRSKRWSASQAKRFRNSFRIQHLHRVHGSSSMFTVLLRHLKCGLSGMNGFIKMNN